MRHEPEKPIARGSFPAAVEYALPPCIARGVRSAFGGVVITLFLGFTSSVDDAKLTRWKLTDAGAVPATAAATYHVAATGDDAADGSARNPFKTIQRAADVATAGDLVLVGRGEFAGFNLEDKVGTKQNPIIFRGETGAAIIRPGNTPKRPPLNGATLSEVWSRWPHGIAVLRSSWVVIEGFEVTGMPGEEREAGAQLHRGGAGIYLEVCRHVTVRNNNAHDNGRWGIFGAFCDDAVIEDNVASGSRLEHGIYLSNSGDRPIIRRNHVFGNNGSGIQINADNNFDSEEYRAFAPVDGITTGALVADNEIVDNGRRGGAAINLDGVSTSIIRDNVITGNHGTGIALFQQNGATGSQRNELIGNTIDMAPDGRWAILMVGCRGPDGSTCAAASQPRLASWARPAALVSGSTGNSIVRNTILTRSAMNGSIRVDTRSLAADATTGAAFTSDDNIVVDRFGIDAEILTLAQWRTRTGRDASSRLGVP